MRRAFALATIACAVLTPVARAGAAEPDPLQVGVRLEASLDEARTRMVGAGVDFCFELGPGCFEAVLHAAAGHAEMVLLPNVENGRRAALAGTVFELEAML